MYLSIEIYKANDNIFLAICPELNLYSHGDTKEDAINKLKEDTISLLTSSYQVTFLEEEMDFAHYYSSGYPRIH